MFQISFYVPVSHAEQVKSAMFDAGGGKIGDYDRCCFEYEGLGQFRPLQGSNPFLGNEGMLEKVKELKVEMVCDDHLIEEVIGALKASHPYETPAYYVTKIVGM